MTRAEICRNRVQLEGWANNDDLLAKIRKICGRNAAVFRSLSVTEEHHFPFEDGSTLNVDFVDDRVQMYVIPPRNVVRSEERDGESR